jgi:hypothetical protein
MNDFDLRKYLGENKLVKEDDNDGSQYHIDQIDDDLMEIYNSEDVDSYLDNIIKGIEELRIRRKEVIGVTNFGDPDADINEDVGDIEEISITGDYMGEPEIYSGHNFGKFLKEMLELALNEDDFVNKVIMGVTDELSSISREDEMKVRQYYRDKYVGDTDDHSHAMRMQGGHM